jgi:hypothetical protein
MNKITFHSERISERPDRKDQDSKEQEWGDGAFHHKVTLKRGPKRFSTYYSMGSRLPEPPDVMEVLDSLASDASTYENCRGFEDWAGEYGYDTDSRKAEKIYNQIGEVARKLKSFLGEAPYKELLYETERL